MQEEVENRTVNLAISTTKLTGRTIIAGKMCIRDRIWKDRFEKLNKDYEELKQKAQPFLDAIEIASEKVWGHRPLCLLYTSRCV